MKSLKFLHELLNLVVKMCCLKIHFAPNMIFGDDNHMKNMFMSDTSLEGFIIIIIQNAIILF